MNKETHACFDKINNILTSYGVKNIFDDMHSKDTKYTKGNFNPSWFIETRKEMTLLDGEEPDMFFVFLMVNDWLEFFHKEEFDRLIDEGHKNKTLNF